MGDDNGGFIFVCLITFVLVVLMNGCLPSTDAYKYRKAIQECEKSLPRDEHCVVIGVRIDKD